MAKLVVFTVALTAAAETRDDLLAEYRAAVAAGQERQEPLLRRREPRGRRVVVLALL